MKFAIVGANKETGDDVQMELIADSQAIAEKQAHERGVMIASIRVVPPAKAAELDEPIELEPEVASAAAPAASAVAVAAAHAEAAPVAGAKPADAGHHPEPAHHDASLPHDQVRHMQYKLVMNQSLMLLENAINRYLKDGWEPQGGLTVGTSNNAMQFFQAVVRRPLKQ